jgi:hypothetical protein
MQYGVSATQNILTGRLVESNELGRIRIRAAMIDFKYGRQLLLGGQRKTHEKPQQEQPAS